MFFCEFTVSYWKQFNIYLFMLYVYLCFACIYVCIPPAYLVLIVVWSEEGVRSLKNGIIDSCEMPSEYWE